MGGMITTMMWISNVLWLGLIFAMGLGVWYWIRSHEDILGRDGDPLAIVKLRLVRGEITLEEYEELQRRLQS
ncbi:MAG: SHOCT domain-containing protein [Firmicutes bacterium]|nr:SHOCT domain-containing protein [Bacillota bacterium]